MKHPEIKYQIIKYTKIRGDMFSVKIKKPLGWRYVAYYKEAGEVCLFNTPKEYDTEKEAYEALRMYQEYGESDFKGTVINSN